MPFISTIKPLAFLLGLTLVLTLSSASKTTAQEDANGKPLKVGDLIEVDFHGKQQVRIKSFRRDWPICEVEFSGKKMERFFPDHRVTLLESAGNLSQPSDQPTAPKTKMRSWTDATGSFTITAKLLSNKNGKIELEKEDGRVVTLPAVKLSEKDQAYLKEVEKAAAAEADEDNPFAGGEVKPKGTSRSGGATAATMPLIVPEITSSIVLSDASWNVQPDPGAEVSPSNKIINFSTSMTKHAFHNSVASVFSPGGQFVGASISNPFEKKMEIVTVDLESEQSSDPVTIGSKDTKLLALSEDGKSAVTLLKGRGRDPGKLEFWTLSDGNANNTASWKTASFGDRGGFAPSTARFIDPSRLLTFGRSVVLWDCETAAALYSFAIPRGSSPVLSPGGNQLAVASGESIYFVNVKDGQSLGSIETDDAVQRVAFSQNGRFLAGLSHTSGEIWIWDLTNQELIRQFSAPGGVASSIQWCGDKYILVDSKALMDVELRATVWRYTSNGGQIVNGHDGRFWFVSKSKVTPIQLPHKDLDAITAKYDPDELLLLKPGSEVSIKLDTNFAPSQEREIREKLTSALNARNINVRQGAELQIIGTVKKQKQKTIEVTSLLNRFGRRGTEKITYTPNLATLHLAKNGNNLWGKTRHFSPGGLIHSNGDESTQQAANRLCKPNPSFFTAMKFPKHIGRLPAGETPGKSTINAQGIQ